MPQLWSSEMTLQSCLPAGAAAWLTWSMFAHRVATSLPLFSTSTLLPCWQPFCEEHRAPGTSIQDPEKQSGPGYLDANPKTCGVFNQKCGVLVMTMCEILDGLAVCSVLSVVPLQRRKSLLLLFLQLSFILLLPLIQFWFHSHDQICWDDNKPFPFFWQVSLQLY